MEEARELLLKHLYLQGGDGLGISDGRVYNACLDAIMEALTIPDVVASLPDANKLYKMAETIVSKQVLIYNMPENRQIDWEDLKNDWFDWLDEEIKG